MNKYNKDNPWMPIDTAPIDVSFYAADTKGRYFLGSIIDEVFAMQAVMSHQYSQHTGCHYQNHPTI